MRLSTRALAALFLAPCLVNGPHLLAEDVLLSEVVNIRLADFEFARPVLNKTAKNDVLRIAGTTYEKGVGTEVDTTILIALKGASRFSVKVGLDDASPAGSEVSIDVLLDGVSRWKKNLRAGQPAEPIDLETKGAKELTLIMTDLGNPVSHALVDWVDGRFEYNGDRPGSVPVPSFKEEAVILTPKPAPTPRINGARVVGARPGNPFFFQVPATGDRPMTFAAENLPAGLTLNASTGLITGKVEKPGTHVVTLKATNARGSDQNRLRIEIGERLALTPPMGWNSWNCWGPEVDADKVLRSARVLVTTGLIHHGWTYVNIDDAWQAPKRGGSHHAIQPNEKFPNIKKLVDEIHAMGLKAGIYSTPSVRSYAKYIGGSADNPEGIWPPLPEHENLPPADGVRVAPAKIGKYSFAVNDARQWAEWGFDYLKYDWNPNRLPETAEMYSALRTCGRDIVFSLSNSMPFGNVAELSHVSHLWRTTGDIHDTWGRMSGIGFNQDKWRPFAGPGHWNDPDMLVIGYVDVGKGKNLHPTRLTPNEQYTHISLWAILAAPLLIGCDLERADEFTLNLLTNHEVIDISQDALGRQGAQVKIDGRRQVWVRELEDGSRAIGFFNLHKEAQPIQATLAELGLKAGTWRVRDVWRQKDLAPVTEAFSFDVPRHGVMLVRVWPEKK